MKNCHLLLQEFELDAYYHSCGWFGLDCNFWLISDACKCPSRFVLLLFFLYISHFLPDNFFRIGFTVIVDDSLPKNQLLV